MFKLKGLRFLVPALALLAGSLSAHDHKHHSHSHHHHDNGFSLSDYAGTYQLTSQSVGGISGESGFSQSAIGQITFDKKGNGKFSFYSGAVYTGPIGSEIIVNTLLTPDFVVTLTILDPFSGAGEINFASEALGLNESGVFVVNTKKGDIRSIDGHVTEFVLNNQSVASFLPIFSLKKQR